MSKTKKPQKKQTKPVHNISKLATKRRDYQWLFQHLDFTRVPDHVKILLIGGMHHTGEEIIEDYFNHSDFNRIFTYTHEKYVAEEILHSYVACSDFIMPLIHPLNSTYLKDRISGSINLGLAYKKPFLIHEKQSCYSDFENNLTYSEESLSNVISEIKPMKNMHHKGEREFLAQKERYTTFLESFVK